jgi:hypothetical protein
MHPYELGRTLREHGDDRSIKFNHGSLYMVIGQLARAGFVTEQETSRAGQRPERTVYALTDAGYEELLDWMRDLIRDPVKEYPQFEAGLCLIPVLPPDEAIALLSHRAARLAGDVAQLETQLAHVAQQDLAAIAGPQELPPALKGVKKFPPLFTVEAEYRLALLKAEHAFVAELVRRIVEEGWGPRDLWRDVQAAAARQHEKDDNDEEAAT